MKEEKMSAKEIKDELAFEDSCKVNTLLQNLIALGDKAVVYKVVNDKNEKTGYKIRDKITGEDIQL